MPPSLYLYSRKPLTSIGIIRCLLLSGDGLFTRAPSGAKTLPPSVRILGTTAKDEAEQRSGVYDVTTFSRLPQTARGRRL